MVALLGQRFYSAQIPACLWLVVRWRSRVGEVLVIDAPKMCRVVDHTQ